MTALKYCPNCGIKLNLKVENKICPGCGVDLNKFVTDSIVNASTEKINKDEKSLYLSNLGIFGIFTGIVLIVTGVLFLSGIFNSNQKPVNQISSPKKSGTGVEQTNLQKINELEKLVDSNPGNPAHILGLANQLQDLGEFEKAIYRYKQYLELNPKDADALIDMGVCYFELSRYDAADSVMQVAIRIKPDHQKGLYNLGVVNLKNGKIEKSREWFKKLIAIDPNSDFSQKAKSLLESH